MLSAIIAIIGGLIAASSLIVAKKPNAQELLDKITPYQGWIGVVLLIYSVQALLSSLRYFSISGLLMSAIMFVVGFLLAYSLISKYLLEKNEDAKIKGQALRAKLVKFQVPAGVALVVLGILSLLGIF
ncbi:MAG: hypothetical protein L3J23_07225 [Flavobacteriaceae bacterium]|nr:hypothetical protein [Flavobacteriaceae bacterium]